MTLKKLLACAIVSACLHAATVAAGHPGQDQFIRQAVDEFGLDGKEVEALLNSARYQQSIIDAITQPAEAKPWHDYRPIFLTIKRIRQGVEFWRENAGTIAAASRQFAVDEAIIVAIIGVESSYGRITGSYRVLDALTTLGFYYPQRAGFFSGELLQFFKLATEEDLPMLEVLGSYAGAMGLGQFIPSSYRAYAVDFDSDGSRDLWRSVDDAIGSVANYLHQHQWHAGEKIVLLAVRHKDAKTLPEMGIKPESTAGELASAGYLTALAPASDTPVSLLELEQRSGTEYWLTLHNFYVITRYNRSPLYAMAVYQLSQEITAEMSRQ